MSDIDRELVERFIDDDLRTAAVLKQGAGRMRQGAAEIARLQAQVESDAKVIAALREALKPFAALDVRGWVADPLISGSTYAGAKMQIDRADFHRANQATTGVDQSAVEQTMGKNHE
jgi:hypothetical protein